MKCDRDILSKRFYIFELFYIKFPSNIWIPQWHGQIHRLLFLDQSAEKKFLGLSWQRLLTNLSAESSVSDPGGSLVSTGSGFIGPGLRPGLRPRLGLVPYLDARPTWPGV